MPNDGRVYKIAYREVFKLFVTFPLSNEFGCDWLIKVAVEAPSSLSEKVTELERSSFLLLLSPNERPSRDSSSPPIIFKSSDQRVFHLLAFVKSV